GRGGGGGGGGGGRVWCGWWRKNEAPGGRSNRRPPLASLAPPRSKVRPLRWPRSRTRSRIADRMRVAESTSSRSVVVRASSPPQRRHVWRLSASDTPVPPESLAYAGRSGDRSVSWAYGAS